MATTTLDRSLYESLAEAYLAWGLRHTPLEWAMDTPSQDVVELAFVLKTHRISLLLKETGARYWQSILLGPGSHTNTTCRHCGDLHFDPTHSGWLIWGHHEYYGTVHVHPECLEPFMAQPF